MHLHFTLNAGVSSAQIGLLSMKAEITYDPWLIQPVELAKKVEDLGFTADIIEVTIRNSKRDSSKELEKETLDVSVSVIGLNV